MSYVLYLVEEPSDVGLYPAADFLAPEAAAATVSFRCSVHFKRPHVLGKTGLQRLRGLRGEQSIPILQRAAAALNAAPEPDFNYAHGCLPECEARQALLQLLALARQKPQGVWQVETADWS